MRTKKYNLLELAEYRKEWDVIKTDLLPEADKGIYDMKKKAVDMYIDDCPAKDILKITGITPNRLPGLIERCILVNPSNGRQYGYSALIPNKKLKSSSMKSNTDSTSKSKGAFKLLLLKYPSLNEFVINTYFGKTSLEKRVTPSNLHKKFLEECRRLKIQDYEYPFNTTDCARRTFYSYLKKLEREYGNLTVLRESRNSQQKFFSTGKGHSIRPIVLAPFSIIQIDGHKIDMLYTVEVMNRYGEILRMPAMRLWLIAVIDTATRVIIGYSISANENYNQIDVLHAIKNTIIPKKPMEFKLAGLKYPDNFGYSSLAIPETEWAMPETIMLDNAKSHLADNVISKLCMELHCSMNFGSVATPETRGIIERVFKTLEDNGYHRLVSTTGSNTSDIRRENAERDAVKYQITFMDIVQLTEYFIALYNNSPHKSLDGQTPLECMRRRIVDAGMQPCIADAEMKQRVCQLTNITEIKTVRGSIKNGKRPYITYKGCEYRNDILSQTTGLIGKKLIIDINPDDISTLKGYFEDGTELGILTAVGEWGRRRHSLKTREEALKFANHNNQKNNPFYAPLSELENELNERALNERRARTKAARIRSEQNKELKTSHNETPHNITHMPTKNNSSDILISLSEEEAIQRKRENYTSDEINAIMNAGSLEEAFKQGLI